MVIVGESDLEYFARPVEALEPWLKQVDIVDVWAQRLYRQDFLAQPLIYVLFGSFDTDAIVPLQQPVMGGLIRE